MELFVLVAFGIIFPQQLCRAGRDSAGELEGFWMGQNLLGLEYGPDELAALIEDVTVRDVTAAACSIQCDMIYFMRGGENGDA